MRESRVARDDLLVKLREANVASLEKVQAVVLETTGDVTVLHGDALDENLLAGVRNTRFSDHDILSRQGAGDRNASGK